MQNEIKIIKIEVYISLRLNRFSWIWEHSKVNVSFAYWLPNRPNTEEHNQDDCAVMDCNENDQCLWLDRPCYQNDTQLNDNEITTTTGTKAAKEVPDVDISFICQKRTCNLSLCIFTNLK